MFGKLKPAEAIREGMNRMKRDTMENAKIRQGVIQHKDGSIERYTETSVERGTSQEFVVAGAGDFHTASKVFALSTMPVQSLLPSSRPNSADAIVEAIEGDLTDTARLLRNR